MNPAPLILANKRYLSTGRHETNEAGLARSYYSYDSKDHLWEEMQHARYWGPLLAYVQAGDRLIVTDAAMREYEIRIDEADKNSQRAWISIKVGRKDGEILYRPITSADATIEDQGLTVRFMGPRGGQWCVLDGEGNTIAQDSPGRADAERKMANLLETRKASEAQAAAALVETKPSKPTKAA